MPGFHLYRSASTQSLADEFVRVVTAPEQALPLDQDEIVVVQGRGMERWLSQRAAAKLGIWAGAEFPFPRAAAARLAASVLGVKAKARVADDSLVLMFAVAAELPALMERPESARVRAYVGDDGVRLLSFAQQVAGVMDAYLVFRPTLLDAWGRGELTLAEGAPGASDEAWQAALWRALQARAKAATEANEALRNIVEFWPAIRRATEALAAGALCEGVQRVSVFAVASVPPQLVQFFAALGRCCDVRWYAVDPAAETAGSPDALVASLGAADLECTHVVHEAAEAACKAGVPVEERVLPAPVAARPESLLARVQARAMTGRASQPHEKAEEDRSLRVHACPSSMREAEVLHDEILRALDELPGLALEDIAVLVPDIAAYAPAIEAVLEGGRGIEGKHGTARIRTSVADVSDRDGSPVAVALASALALADSDMGVRSVIELLAQPVVAQRHMPVGVAPEDVARWMTEAGAKRFLDSDHRSQSGLPERDWSNWSDALERLCAGVAAPPGTVDPEPNAHVFPAQPFMASPIALGRLMEWCDFLGRLRRCAVGDYVTGHGPLSIGEWMSGIRDVLEELVPTHGESGREAREVRERLTAIGDAARVADFQLPVPFSAVRTMLVGQLSAARPGRRFLDGGVTVCQFVPMRAVPFRVVCMIGMDDDSFPRASTRPAFDLAQYDRVPGDRDARSEDRALFLESVLGTGERLVVIYSNRNPMGGTERALSTTVVELMSAAAAVGAPRDSLVVQHSLHAFSVGAFDETAVGQKRIGYDARARIAAERLHSGRVEPRPPVFLQDRPLDAAGDSNGEPLSLEDLLRFFRDPARATLQSWGLHVAAESKEVPDLEMVDLEGFEAGGVRYRLLEQGLANDARLRDDVVERMQQQGQVPWGAFAGNLGRGLKASVDGAFMRAYPKGARNELIDLTACNTRVVGGVLCNQRAVAVVAPRPGALATLRAWIHQVAFAVSQGGAPSGSLIFVSGAKEVPLPEIDADDAIRQLDALVRLRAAGLRHGLPFFAEASCRAAGQLVKGASKARVLSSIGPTQEDELSESAKTLFRGVDPFAVELGEIEGVCANTFIEVAGVVFGEWWMRRGAS